MSREAERRVLGFINPGLPDRFGATHTLWAGFQYVLPGEVAPAHRHSPAAIRFVIEGRGAFTTVDGDKCVMERGDLVLTPPWTWHDHGNDSDRPMLWLDGLDLPMVGEMEGQFYEPFAEEAQPIGKPVGDSERRYGIGQLRPTWDDVDGLPLAAAQLQVGPDGGSACAAWPRSRAPPARSTTWRWSTSTRTPAAR